MGWLRYFRRAQRDEDFALELEAHLQHEIDQNIARGMNPREAGYAARRKFGNITRAKETTHRMNTIGFFESIGQDLRYAARLFRLEPGFFTVAILCLALGIGANTAIFHLLDAVRLRTLPVASPQELAEVQIGPDQKCCMATLAAGVPTSLMRFGISSEPTNRRSPAFWRGPTTVSTSRPAARRTMWKDSMSAAIFSGRSA